jgi:hypothetical protein
VEVTPGGLVRLYVATISGGIGLFFLYVFHERYWLWRHCFNDQGRCWDPVSEQVFLEQAGVLWGGLAGIFLACALVAVLWPRRQ